jgi:hypothetical protein
MLQRIKSWFTGKDPGQERARDWLAGRYIRMMDDGDHAGCAAMDRLMVVDAKWTDAKVNASITLARPEWAHAAARANAGY